MHSRHINLAVEYNLIDKTWEVSVLVKKKSKRVN